MRYCLPLLLALCACAEFPELEGTIPASEVNGPYPALVPLAPLVAEAAESDTGSALVERDLTARLSTLRTRAARLRGPVIPAPVRTRMLRGVR